jgi:NTE family protein
MSTDPVGEGLAWSLIGSAMDEPLLRELRHEFAWLSLPGGRKLFEEGEVGGSLYIVITGALVVTVRNEDGGAEIIARVRPGETIGEMSLLSGEARSATVTALRDSELLRLDKPVFEQLIARMPGAMMPIIWQLIRRLRQTTHRTAPPPSSRTIAIVPISPGTPAVEVANDLVAALREQGGRVELVDAAAERHPTEWFAALEAERDLVVYLADTGASPWSQLCLRQADRVLLLVGPGAAPDPAANSALTELLGGSGALGRPIDLVMLCDGDAPPRDFSVWQNRFRIDLGCILRHRHRGDLGRIARLLTGRAVGVVLSGGGARGFAHIGVIRALREMQVPIDLVAGCSMGAIIAAGVAAEWDDATLTANMRAAFVASSPVNDYALPLLALVRGKKVSSRLAAYFGETAIESLWRPFFCVSADLAGGTLVVHRTGTLWRALRASVAIPGLLPPVIDGRAVLADGGVMNNLPVDVMRALKRGPVIGIDVASDRALTSFAGDEEGGSLWSFLRSGRKVPPIVDILVRAGTVTTEVQSRMLRKQVDLLLEPPLEKIEILDWRAFDRAIEIGYRYAVEKLQADGDALWKAR